MLQLKVTELVGRACLHEHSPLVSVGEESH
jgi:hypothetical protein